MKKLAVIRKCKSGDAEEGKPWCVYNKEGTKLLGRHPSKESAEKQLAAIEISKHGDLKKAIKLLGEVVEDWPAPKRIDPASTPDGCSIGIGEDACKGPKDKPKKRKKKDKVKVLSDENEVTFESSPAPNEELLGGKFAQQLTDADVRKLEDALKSNGVPEAKIESIIAPLKEAIPQQETGTTEPQQPESPNAPLGPEGPNQTQDPQLPQEPEEPKGVRPTPTVLKPNKTMRPSAMITAAEILVRADDLIRFEAGVADAIDMLMEMGLDINEARTIAADFVYQEMINEWA
jgi:hypothetical protein